MLCLCGFELYSRWVPLNKLWPKRTAFFEDDSAFVSHILLCFDYRRSTSVSIGCDRKIFGVILFYLVMV